MSKNLQAAYMNSQSEDLEDPDKPESVDESKRVKAPDITVDEQQNKTQETWNDDADIYPVEDLF